jgi:hypothetical protein
VAHDGGGPTPETIRSFKASKKQAKAQRKRYLSKDTPKPKAGSPLTPLNTPKPLANAKPGKPPKKHGGLLGDIAHVVGETAHTLYPRSGSKRHGKPGATMGVPTVSAGGPMRAAKNIGIAIADKPGPTIKHTVTGARDIVAAIPSGVVAAATTRPDRTLKKMADDIGKRYGETDAQMVKRFEKHGIAPELLDATALTSGGGAAVGRVVTKAAETGKLGERASAVATAARPALRTSGGKLKAQPKSKNYLRAEIQTARDTRRVRKQHKAELAVENVKPLSPVRAEVARRNKAAGKVVEVTHAGLPLVGTGERAVAKAQRMAVAANKGRAVHQLKSEQHRIVEKTARRVLNQLTPHERRAFHYVATGTISGDPLRAAEQLAKRRQDIVDARAAAGTPELKGLRKNTDELRTIDKLIAHPHESFTPRVRDTVQALRAVDIHVGRGDPALTAQQRLLRRYSQQAEVLGLRRGEGATTKELLNPARLREGQVGKMYDPEESSVAFIKRVQAEADKHGLERPLYFPSEKYDIGIHPDRAAYAVGGSKAVSAPHRYTGALFRTGRQDTRPEVYLAGLARSIKRKHNWNLVVRQLDDHAFEGMQHTTISRLRDTMATRGIDPQSVAFWNPNIYRKTLQETQPRTGLQQNLAAAEHDAGIQEGDEFGQAAAQHAITKALVLPEHVTSDLMNKPGWSVIPRAAHNEIMHAAKAGGPLHTAGRVWDIAKGKQSRILLGTLNIPWLGFQVASNALLAAGATGGRILPALAEQSKWYHALPVEQRDAVDALVGDAAGHSNAANIKLGASSNTALVNGYRALKANPIWDRPIFKGRGPSMRQLNPIEAMFQLDHKQNTLFRRAVLHDQMKRAAARQMADDIHGIRATQGHIVKALDGGPQHVMNAMLKDRAVMEQHAHYVDQWLGNWTTFTHAERTTVNRAVMFYPFLRFSLKLAFHTLPAHHPVLASIAAKLGQLQQEELRKLGVTDLPWAGGRLYFERGGKLHQIDLARANPLANSLTSIRQPSQLVGMLPPAVSAVADQLFHRNNFKDAEWKVGGKPSQFGKKGSDYALGARGRIFMEQMLKLAFPYREAEKLTMLGPQGDDSMLISPRPTKYKKKEIVQAISKSVKEQQKQSKTSRLAQDVVPFIGAPSTDQVVAKQQAKLDKPAKKKRKTYGVGGSYGGGYGKGSYGGGGYGG